MNGLRGVLLLALLGALAEGRAPAAVLSVTNRVVLTWGSLGAGTLNYVQTSTNLRTWTGVTNTAETNTSLSFSGDKSRAFRVVASNAPPQTAKVAWNASVPLTDVSGYSIYYGVSTGNFTNVVTVGLATNGVVPNLAAGTTYYFAMTSHTSSGWESVFSSETTWRTSLRLSIQQAP